MPHGFEYVVRPFQSPGSLGNVVIPGTPERTTEQAHITWGGVGTMPSAKMLYPSTVVNTHKEDLVEENRDSEVERIIGNDGESYVDVARAKKVRLDKTETDTSNLNRNYYAAEGPKLDEKLAEYLDSFTRLNETAIDATKQGKVTWTLKNQ